jgi:hypothetical protein
MQAENKIKTAGEIQSQLNRLNELLDGLEKEVDLAKEAYGTVIVNYDIPIGGGIGVGDRQDKAPVPLQSAMAHMLGSMNERLQNSINQLADMRSKCQL